MKHIPILVFLTIAISCSKPVPRLDYLERPVKVHFRGASSADGVVYLSGTNGTVAKSDDIGKTWSVFRIPEMENIDFRDVEARSAKQAFVLSAGNPGVILETKDGGELWEERFFLRDSSIFLDGMAFNPRGESMVFGDPYQGQLACLKSPTGETWTMQSNPVLVPNEGEAGFAASGSGVQWTEQGFAFVTGGPSGSRFIRPRTKLVSSLPLAAEDGAGAFSMAVGKKAIVVVGGSYLDSLKREGNAAYSLDDGRTWKSPETPPFGYRSVVISLGQNRFLAAGRTGVDFSHDNGKTWKMISSDGFFTATRLGQDKVILAGRNGKVALVHF